MKICASWIEPMIKAKSTMLRVCSFKLASLSAFNQLTVTLAGCAGKRSRSNDGRLQGLKRIAHSFSLLVFQHDRPAK